MATEYKLGQMAPTMKESGNSVELMDMGYLITPQGTSTKETLRRIKLKVMEFSLARVDRFTKVNGTKT